MTEQDPSRPKTDTENKVVIPTSYGAIAVGTVGSNIWSAIMNSPKARLAELKRMKDAEQ